MTEPVVPRYLNWSEQPVMWSRADHLPQIDNPSELALVVAPQVGGYRLLRSLRMEVAASIFYTTIPSGG